MDFTSGWLFFRNAYKSVISSLVLLWCSRSTTCPMQIPKYNPTTAQQNLKLGLETLLFKPESLDNRHAVHKNYKLTPPAASPLVQSYSSLTSSRSLLDNTSTWTSSMMDDLLGTDSGVAFMATSDDDLFTSMTTSSTRSNLMRKNRQGSEKVIKREFPPPIPLLAQTGNLQCRMPWNLTRHYSNGRLVLHREKAQHHEYFEAERDNGRLVLKLVPLDNAILTSYDAPEPFVGHLEVCEENDEELEMDCVQFSEGGLVENDNDDDDDDDATNDDECDDDNEYDNIVDESKTMFICNSMPQSQSEISRCAQKYGNLPKYFTKSAAIHEQQQNYFAHPASAPLRPITAVI